jgi:hypothetical protein
VLECVDITWNASRVDGVTTQRGRGHHEVVVDGIATRAWYLREPASDAAEARECPIEQDRHALAAGQRIGKDSALEPAGAAIDRGELAHT